MKKPLQNQLALLLALVLVLTLASGCGAKPASPNIYPATDEAYYEESASALEAEPASAESQMNDEAMAELDLTADSSGNASGSKPSLAEKIIYSGDLYIETTTFDQAITSLEAKVDEFGGFIESSYVNGNTDYRPDGTTALVDRRAYYVARIPSARFDAFLKLSGTIGNVLSSSTSADNITSQFTDTEARKASLQVQEQRLLSMMEATTDIESLIALESRLSEVRYELESIERQLINWQNQVDYSTVSLELQEVEVYTPVAPVQRTFGQKLVSAFSDGWNGFLRFAQNLALFVAEALPALILLALVVLAIVLIVRAAGRRKKQTKHRPGAVSVAVAVEADAESEQK